MVFHYPLEETRVKFYIRVDVWLIMNPENPDNVDIEQLAKEVRDLKKEMKEMKSLIRSLLEEIIASGEEEDEDAYNFN